ncbi:hypothetical protein FGG08_000495 [Glutinoglossum americanum]|uniref:Uncharacterized protein n=1 Tax=Glutinoglossum americanum TaxID=1670608 RepID=A0A9P8I905_9PEZI|nr:hypothetical protein FGG08_000495 [Glutinoglossum americanum]
MQNKKAKRRAFARNSSARTRKAKERTSTREPSAHTRNKKAKREKQQFLIRQRLNGTPWEKVHSAYEEQFGKASLDTIRCILYSSEYHKRQRSMVRMVHYTQLMQDTTNGALIRITDNVGIVELDSTTANGVSADSNSMINNLEDCYLNAGHSTASDPKHTNLHGLGIGPARSRAPYTELYPRALEPGSTNSVPSDTDSWTFDSEPLHWEPPSWGTPTSEVFDYLNSGVFTAQVFSLKEINLALLGKSDSDVRIDSSIPDAQVYGLQGPDSERFNPNISDVQAYGSQGLDSELPNLSISNVQSCGLEGPVAGLLSTSVSSSEAFDPTIYFLPTQYQDGEFTC